MSDHTALWAIYLLLLIGLAVQLWAINHRPLPKREDITVTTPSATFTKDDVGPAFIFGDDIPTGTRIVRVDSTTIRLTRDPRPVRRR